MSVVKKTRYLSLAIGCGVALTVRCALADQVPPAPVMRETGARIAVAQFRFSGNAAQPSSTLAPLLASWRGRALTLAELKQAAEVIQRHYRAHGWFLAQAYVPAQLPADGIVEIAVLEGRIDTVTVYLALDAPIEAGYASALVGAALHSGQTITEQALEGPLLLLRDVARLDATALINPGRAPGSASITINVLKDPEVGLVNGRVDLDNYGSRVAGANRLGAELNVNNPYGLGDVLSLNGFIANANGNGFGRAGYTLPLGAGGARVGVSVARLDYVLGQAFDSLRPNGVATVVSAQATYPLLRSRSANLLAQLLVERKELEDRTALPLSSDRQRLSAVRLQLSGDARDRHAGVTLFSISASAGTLRENDLLRVANDALTYRSEGRFAKYLVSLQRLQPLAPGVQAMFSASGQMANKNLTSAEKYALGGDSSVRAYPVGALVGDQGYSATAELRWAPAALQSRVKLAGILFYDLGQVTRNHDNRNPLVSITNNHARIAGYGSGLNLGIGAHVLVRVALAWQGKKLAPSDPAAATLAGGARAWAQASYAF